MLFLLSCSSPPDVPIDSASESNPIDTDMCTDAPVLRWTNFGESFMTHTCQGCHASTAANRYGAPEEHTFDTVDEVWTQRNWILGVATGEDPSMPPEGGVSADDRKRLELWLLCAPEGT
ncbi:MAG: hypothetical protein GY884_28610 [Proteobacteria bacterium]|nr:hypothetical protein [Pseudomonadota bacterium]